MGYPDEPPPPHDASVDVWYPPDDSGVVVLPGDNPDCVHCAYDHCRSVMGPCFTNSSLDPSCVVDGSPTPDCCVDYRRCLDQCLTSHPDAGPDYAQCVSEICDTRYPNGKVQFGPYDDCMRANCAGCAGDAG